MKTYMFPGQGSQAKGMGGPLFDRFPEMTATADTVLGYSIKQLCLEDPERLLNLTQFTQPALYVVNYLTYLQKVKDGGVKPDYVLGHSLGEYDALAAAGAFTFADGLQLVRKRGELMSKAPKGAMGAVLGLSRVEIADFLESNGLSGIDIANYNSPLQIVISGLGADIAGAGAAFGKAGVTFIPLNTSGAFHSRQMAAAKSEFRDFLCGFSFSQPEIPVISNVHARPYLHPEIADNLCEQITQSVRWSDSILYLMGLGEMEFEELGPGNVLTKLAVNIKKQSQRANSPEAAPAPMVVPASSQVNAQPADQPGSRPNDPSQNQAIAPAPANPGEAVEAWNRSHPIGAKVRVKKYDSELVTKTKALILFGHRAAIYMEGYNGYFALEEVLPV